MYQIHQHKLRISIRKRRSLDDPLSAWHCDRMKNETTSDLPFPFRNELGYHFHHLYLPYFLSQSSNPQCSVILCQPNIFKKQRILIIEDFWSFIILTDHFLWLFWYYQGLLLSKYQYFISSILSIYQYINISIYHIIKVIKVIKVINTSYQWRILFVGRYQDNFQDSVLAGIEELIR
jgi:hypothetical protein